MELSEEENKAIECLNDFNLKYEPFVFYRTQQGDTSETNFYIKKYEHNKILLNLIKKQQEKIELKDKIIDEMIGNFTLDWFSENICKYEECKENCIDCAKQYFMNEVKEELK